MPLDTPVLEHSEILLAKAGGETEKQIYRFLKGDTDITMRFDLTVPLAKYVAKNYGELTFPFRRYQIGKVYRGERSQRGRFREFYQSDIDIIGDGELGLMNDAEIPSVIYKIFNKLGLDDFTIRINDRRILTDMILGAGFNADDVMSVCIIFDKLDKIGIDGVKAELLEKEYNKDVVDTFISMISEAEEDALTVAEKYCQNKDVVSNIKKVLEFANSISDGKFDAVYDKSLVRGMGYYTGMVFEIASHKFGSSVAGGGRYDEMIGKFLGESVPAVGFSIGFERICAILLDEGFTPPLNEKIVLAYNNDDSFAEVNKKAKELQSNGKIVMMLKRSKKFGKQLEALIENGYSQMINFADDTVKELSK
jgi:histidyl-tRNA synthetase